MRQRESVTLFLSEDGAERAALRVVRRLAASSFTIQPRTLRDPDTRTVERGYVALIRTPVETFAL